jgi:hypothetical protein
LGDPGYFIYQTDPTHHPGGAKGFGIKGLRWQNMRQIRTASQKHGFFDNETKNSLGVVFAIPPNPFTFALLFLEQTLWQTISQQKKEYAQTRRNE